MTYKSDKWRGLQSLRVFLILASIVFQTIVCQASQCVDELVAAGKLKQPFQLRLVDPSGKETQRPAPNVHLISKDQGPEIRPEFQEIAQILLNRSPEAQARINQALNAEHAATGNSFYDKGRKTYFVPDVNAMVVPMPADSFDRLVQSTGPVLRALRKILQGFYSHSSPTAQTLGIQHWPNADRNELIRLLRESIYTEPKYQHPSLGEYPFLFISGFDAVLDSPTDPSAKFYEFNLGTPSGLSNNIQLLEALRQHDPQLFEVLAERMGNDSTFTILRTSLEANAAAWTGDSSGICVILSPGVWNAAHPDVSYLSHFTGLPLVNPSDLYEDASGNIRLNQELGNKDPVIRGIYNRMEEAYLMNSPEEGIPLRSPFFQKINAGLSSRLGLRLEPTIGYDYIFDENNNVTNVNLDDFGKPKFQRFWGGPNGNLLKAVQNRRLYVSNLGGRTVDDKRIFTLVARNTRIGNQESLASPPRTLRQEEYASFFSATDWSQYVVKAPDLSSAEGVYIMANYSDQRQQEIVKMVREAPTRYLIQEYVSAAVVLTPQQENGQWVYGTRPNDLRIFVFMDPNGEVAAGQNSVLLRIAAQDRGESNTGMGGGYGIFFRQQAPQLSPINSRSESVLPRPQKNNLLSKTRRQEVSEFLLMLKRLEQTLGSSNAKRPSEKDAESMAMMYRAVMDLFGREIAPFMNDVRDYASGNLSSQDFKKRIVNYRSLIIEKSCYTDVGVGEEATNVFSSPHS